MKTYNSLTLAVVVGLTVLKYSEVHAQPYPSKPIRVIVASAPGSSTDILARVIGPKLTDRWLQPVVIENRPGAGGILGAEVAARATADGYTFMLINASFAVSAALYKKLSFHPLNDFAPVTEVARQPMVLVVDPSLNINSVKSLIEVAKAKPNQIRAGSNGNGSITHLVTQMFSAKTGVQMLLVTYKGAPPAIRGLLGGEIQVLFPGIVPVLPHIKSGKLRVLAVSTAHRSAALPETPTMSEAGVAGYNESNWQGLLAPVGVPVAIARKFNPELSSIMQLPDVVAKLNALGSEPATRNSMQFAAFIRSEIEKWKKLIAESGARVN